MVLPRFWMGTISGQNLISGQSLVSGRKCRVGYKAVNGRQLLVFIPSHAVAWFVACVLRARVFIPGGW